jgi:hypothetical protein
VATPLALLPCVVLQSAIKFINLTVPSSAGRIGMNLPVHAAHGRTPCAGGRAGSRRRPVGDDRAGGLFLLVLPFVSVDRRHSQFHFKPDQRLLEALGHCARRQRRVVFAVPKVRARVVPASRAACQGSGAWRRVGGSV